MNATERDTLGLVIEELQKARLEARNGMMDYRLTGGVAQARYWEGRMDGLAAAIKRIAQLDKVA